MATLKAFMELHQIVSADFKISPKSGRKVRTQTKNIKDEDDLKNEEVQAVEEGLGRGREDDEYHVPDPVRQPQHKIHVEITPKDSTVKQKRTATVSTHHGREHAVKTALAHYKKQGATVHSHQYGGVHESTEEEYTRLIYETTDQSELRILMLARLGLVDKSDVSKLKLAIDTLKADKPLSVQQRTLLLGVFTTLTELVTGDDQVFNRLKTKVQKESTSIQRLVDLAVKKSQ